MMKGKLHIGLDLSVINDNSTTSIGIVWGGFAIHSTSPFNAHTSVIEGDYVG